MPWNPEHYMKTKEVMKILEENKLTNVQKKKEEEHWWERHKRYIEHRKTYPYGKPPEIKDETKTHSEEMQDELEPIPCPMHEDYDE